jgi:RNA polymerase sigma factor (sigma-70 family)
VFAHAAICIDKHSVAASRARPVAGRLIYNGISDCRTLELSLLRPRETHMEKPDDAVGRAIRALVNDNSAVWGTFVKAVSDAAWKASLRATPRRAQAEALFSHLMSRLHADRFSLPARLDASGLQSAAAFLEREITSYVDRWLIDLLRCGAPEAADTLVRILHSDVKAWTQRAVSPGMQIGVDDVVQDVFVALLADNGRRITAYAGSGSFRGFLRTVVVRLAADSARRERGRRRPNAKGDNAGGRPRLVSLDDEANPLDLADENANPESELLAVEAMTAQAQREAALLDRLRSLPMAEREILEARFLDGRKPREIAALTGRDVKEIYRVLERTLAGLKQVLT